MQNSIKRSAIVKRTRTAPMLAAVFLLACTQDVADHEAQEVSPYGAAADQRRALEQLARSYLFDPAPPGGSVAVTARIRELSAHEARVFHDVILKLNHYRGNERRFYDAFFEHAAARHKATFDLTQEDTAIVIANLTSSPTAPTPTGALR